MRPLRWGWAGVCVLLGMWPVPAMAAPPRPNIVIILADDLGYGDVRCFNPQGKIPTPHMDRAAAAGMIFTDAHTTSAVCTPTRYSLITGRYNWRSRLQSGVLGGYSPRLIEPGCLTLPAWLRQHGYHTACIGKWHLGMDWVVLPGKPINPLGIEQPEHVWSVDFTQPIRNGPTSVGFDEFFGLSASLDMVPYVYIHNDRVVAIPTEEVDFPQVLGKPQPRTRRGPAVKGFAVEDVLPEMTRQAVAYIGRRAEAARNGQPFFLYLPLPAPHSPIAPTRDWQGKSGLNPYADFVMQTDAAIGAVLDAIDRHGLRDNTFVLITSDNGCSPLADFPELKKLGHNPSYHFRGHKADIYEGGHRVPWIVRWPGVVRPGTTTPHLACVTDIFATCADILGEKLPPDAAEDSISLLPLLRGGKEAVRTTLVSHSSNGSFAIREGRWKLCLCPGSGGWSYPRPGRDDTSHLPLVQLFDLQTDIGEQHNLQDRHPEIVRRLTGLLEQYVAEGRSTPGPRQANTVPVDIWKAGRAAHQPLPATNKKKK